MGLTAVRHHLLGKCRHRSSDHGMIHDPTLVEVTNELLNPVVALKRPHPLDAVVRIAEYPYVAVTVLVFDLFEAGQDLAKSLEA